MKESLSSNGTERLSIRAKPLLQVRYTTAYWPGIETIFEIGKEILIAHSPEDVLQNLREMPETDRCAIGERARARVLTEHTAAHRAAQLEQYVMNVSH